MNLTKPQSIPTLTSVKHWRVLLDLFSSYTKCQKYIMHRNLFLIFNAAILMLVGRRVRYNCLKSSPQNVCLILLNRWLLNSFSVHFSQWIGKSYFPLHCILIDIEVNGIAYLNFNNIKCTLKGGITNLVTIEPHILVIYLH